MRKTSAVILALFLIGVFFMNTAPVITMAEGSGTVTGITVECHNTSRNDTGLERYRHTIVVAQLAGTGDLCGKNVYLNITGAVTIHSTGISDHNGTVMWEWIPENLSTATINASYNSTIYDTINREIYPEEDIILDLEHPQTVQLGHRYYFQLFSLSKVSYFEPSGAPYRIRIYRHETNDTHTALVEWTGFLDNHGYKGFYVTIDDTKFDPNLNYEIWLYIYNHTGNISESGDTLIDSDGGKTLGRAEEWNAATYISFYQAYGASSSLWWYKDVSEPANNYYDIATDNIEALNWTHTVYGTVALVGDPTPGPTPDRLSDATNWKNIYFNDTNGNEVWDNDTDGQEAGEISEDIWLDNGNGFWDGNESETGYPDEGYNGTPFLKAFHSFKVDYGLGEESALSISEDTWTWTGYLNASSKTGQSLYENITNCSYVVYQNETGYYYTYGPGITEDFTIAYGSAVCVLATTAETWDRK